MRVTKQLELDKNLNHLYIISPFLVALDIALALALNAARELYLPLDLALNMQLMLTFKLTVVNPKVALRLVAYSSGCELQDSRLEGLSRSEPALSLRRSLGKPCDDQHPFTPYH
jgi:hypothetical protein